MKRKTIAIHQPNYFPWAGYFYKMLKSDEFVFLDNVVMATPGFTNRNRIKTKDGKLWLTVPCKYNYGRTLIKDVKFADTRWSNKHLKTLTSFYKKAKYFDKYIPHLEKIILSDNGSIADLNIKLAKQISEWLRITCVFHVSSELDPTGKGDDRLVDLVTRVGGEVYLSGYGGANYQSEEKFRHVNIELKYYDFKPPIYPQMWGEFISGLSILDLLFNCGPESRNLLQASGEVRGESGDKSFSP